jgi:hypothetical protein
MILETTVLTAGAVASIATAAEVAPPLRAARGVRGAVATASEDAR